MPKIEYVLGKLDKMEQKLDSLRSYVKVVDGKVNRLQENVEQFESFSKDAALIINKGVGRGNVFCELRN